MMTSRGKLKLTCGSVALMLAAGTAHAAAPAPAGAAMVQADTDPARPLTKAERAEAKRRAKAIRQATRAGTTTATYKGAEGNDIIVTGLRGSLQNARNRKRSSKQIVDSVDAEDAGKLPDNNVPETLARITGVQIDRSHGEGTNVTIRGLGDVQTTINGYEAAGAGLRSLNLADIPAELLKSVQVYKTRGADQPEGGIAGTVNVELRRPLDLKQGMTLAGSFRESFSDLGNTKSPYASLLVADRFDTPIGEMGFLVNGSYTRNNYFENYVVSESPQQIPSGTPAYLALPAALQNTIIPYAVNYGVESGSIKRPSLNASWQWKASDHLDFVVEGSYVGVRSTDKTDNLRMVTNDGNGTYSNLVANPDGTVSTVTLNNPNGVGGGPISTYHHTRSDTYTTSFETHYHTDDVQINFSNQYNWSNNKTYFVQDQFRFSGATSADVDFNSPNVPGGGPYISFPGVDISDPANYKLYQIHDERGTNDDTLFASNLDMTVQTSRTGLVRSVQLGARFTKHTMARDYGYRDAFYFNTATAPSLTAVGAATGVGLATTTPDISGASQVPTYYHFDGQSLFDNFGAVRNYLINNGADLQGRDWTLAEPATTDPGESFKEHERTFAAYGQINYGFDAHFPIDGTLGLRFVNTWGTATSSQYTFHLLSTGKPDYSLPVIYTPTSSTSNYIDFLPSATGTIHFTPKMQLRLSYTHNVSRPDFYSMRSSLNLLDETTIGKIYSGNPDLKAAQENSYDASLEYYYGRGGVLSLGTFLKNQTGFIYYTEQRELVPGQPLNPLVADGTYLVGKSRNAGPGKIFGVEGQMNTFFEFLPGLWKNFGLNVNFTYIPVATLHLAYNDADLDTKGLFDAPYTSTYSGNVQFFYDTPQFGARIAYNIRSSYKTYIDYVNPGYSIYTQDTSRLDASVNFTPVKFLTFSVDATNLLHNSADSYFGAYNALPVGVRVQARTIQAGARFRF
ncbi:MULTISPECIES: TonB-dependent receptor [unclassified Sphingomonas]|uniref:TonB-dependent receptor n=1 Tax=unclassified Sphingomonas TaxID=196159 RepID=UPI00226A38F3|nr:MULTISPECIES: TonB-dependent receptor [unclassified Sphingomonas]